MSAGKITMPWAEPPDDGIPFEVAPGIQWVRMPLPMALDHVNCWVLDDDDDATGDGCCIVDTGFDTRLTRDLWTKALNGRTVRRVIVTHHHPDHMGLAGWFRAEHGARIEMSRTAYLMARMLQLDVQDRPAAETVAFWRAAGMDQRVLDRRLDERPFNFADVTAPLPLGLVGLLEETMIRIGRRWWHVHMGGGHAPDHVTLWDEAGDIVIGGDQLLASISPNIGVYATEPEADPLSDWIESCHRLEGFATPGHLVLPGHKLPYRGLPTRMRQLRENHDHALDRLRAHLSTPKSAGECFAPLFGRQVGEGEYGLALVEALAHCLHLWHLGEAERRIDPDGVWRFRIVSAAMGPGTADLTRDEIDRQTE